MSANLESLLTAEQRAQADAADRLQMPAEACSEFLTPNDPIEEFPCLSLRTFLIALLVVLLTMAACAWLPTPPWLLPH